MTIKDVYERFKIPPNLADHMFTVAQVVRTIKDHWKGQIIDWELIEKAALLHDVGNIVKFSFSEEHKQFLGAEAQRIDYWRSVQKEIIQKYGAEDHQATGAMLREIGIKENILDIVQNKSLPNAIGVAQENDWSAKILLYADMRVMPQGIAPLEERLADIRTRLTKYAQRLDFEDILISIRNIEKQISYQLETSVQDILWSMPSETEKKEMLSVVI